MALSLFTPAGEVYLCRGVGLDNAYTDTFTFTTPEAQREFFISKSPAGAHFSNVGPVRVGSPIRLPINANRIYDYDYLMFQNTNYNQKWFYAFITDIEWVNVNACSITYEIDVVQTWYFDFVFPQMFIEREHPNTDTPGDNLIDEGIDVGPMMEGIPKTCQYFNNYSYVIWATYDLSSGGSATFRQYGGIFSGLVANFYDTPAAVGGALQTAISAGKGDAIVCITMFPNSMMDVGHNPISKEWSNTYYPTLDGTEDGYIPRNKKLLTSPYRFLTLSNQEGNVGVFRFENFLPNSYPANQTITFGVLMDLTPTPTAIAIPRGYLGWSGRWDEGVSISNFPQCAWASDVYQAWLAQNSSRLAAGFLNTGIDVIKGAAGAIGGMIASPNLLSGAATLGGGLANAGVNALQSVLSTMAQLKDIQVLPPQAHGNQSSYIQISTGNKTYALTVHYCRDEFAKSIDSFFDMFGYKTNQVKTPNITGRLSWNYVKTIDAHVLGSAPAFVSAQMEGILNNGIRFWHGDYIGVYSRGNPIIPSTRTSAPPFVNLSGEAVEVIE